MATRRPDTPPDAVSLTPETFSAVLNAVPNMAAAISRYAEASWLPSMLAAGYIRDVEIDKLKQSDPATTFADYLALSSFNLDLALRAVTGTMRSWSGLQQSFAKDLTNALLRLATTGRADDLFQQTVRLALIAESVAIRYPQAVREIEPEFGFHFEREDITRKIDETDRFSLYQVLPSEPGRTVREDGKPVLILPPYVLGANILGFLPGDRRSYAHAFANQGVPTYIRILKDIRTSEPLQRMTGEDDANDTRRFCEAIRGRHGNAVTLNGYCQGGFSALCNLLSGVLDGLVDAFITCVAPMDGTRSEGLSDFLKALPDRFNQLDYGTKTLANGNRVADGQLMGWVYRLKSIEEEFPVSALLRDMRMFAAQKGPEITVGKTAAALTHWMTRERFDLPLAITEMSFASFTTPIAKDGTLPVTLFDRPLNINRLREKNMPWLICHGMQDNLVEPAAALAPLDWVDAEVTAFPKGHVAIATSFSHPESDYALHTRFGDDGQRGPVRFHLDLEASPPKKKAPRKRAAAKKRSAPKKKAAAGTRRSAPKKRVARKRT